MEIELNNNLKELIRLAEKGEKSIPDKTLDKQIETISLLIDNCFGINLLMEQHHKLKKIKSDISSPVILDNLEFINLLRMRLVCYKRLKDLYIQNGN